MTQRHTILLVLRSGGDFAFRDVELIARHINGKWRSENRPRIICLYDKASEPYDLGNLEIFPLKNEWPRWWSRMVLYSPEMEQYRPFLYIDLDTVIVKSLEHIFDLVYKNCVESNFITLEDFYQKGKLATGLAWIPAKSDKISQIWKAWLRSGPGPARMDYFLRQAVDQDKFWQQLTDTIYNSKPQGQGFLQEVPATATMVCFHGKPRVYEAAEASMASPWVRAYVETTYPKYVDSPKVTVIIPYKVDRGWLKEAVASVPDYCQLLVSQGEGNWPENFNKALPMARGKYIKYLHEDDMLTPNCIDDSIKAMEEQNADFIHGNVIELTVANGNKKNWKTTKENPTFGEMMVNNYIHSASLMYKRSIFDEIGGFEESLNTAEEYEFNLRCLRSGYRLGFCPTNLAVYRRHPQQKVRTVPVAEKNEERESVRNLYRQ